LLSQDKRFAVRATVSAGDTDPQRCRIITEDIGVLVRPADKSTLNPLDQTDWVSDSEIASSRSGQHGKHVQNPAVKTPMHDLFWLCLLLPVYAVARYLRAGSAGWFILVAWLANAVILAVGGLWIGLTGMLATGVIAFVFRERLQLVRFFRISNR
jgi:hypothetical protein